MVKRLLLACLLAFAPALAAVETTTITGSVVDPAGTAATGGTVRWSLSTAGTALDGATPVTVSGDTVCTLTGAGAFSGCALVPNDAITPTGTYYTAKFSVTTAQGNRSWSRMYSVTTSPDPVALGSVTALNVAPGITVGPFVQVQDAAPSGSCTTQQMPIFSRTADAFYDCNSSTWAAVSTGGGSLSDGDKGDVTVSSSGTAWAIDRGVTLNPSMLNGVKYCGDTDGDGTLEGSELQTCIDILCDADSNGIQDSRLADLDGDGSADDLYCGTVVMAPGTWALGASGTYARILVKWQGVTLKGAGTDKTILRADFTRATQCAAISARQAHIHFQDPDSSGPLSVDYGAVEDLTVIGIGARTSAGDDCNEDATGGDNGQTDGIQFEGYRDASGATDDPVNGARIRNVKVLRVDMLGIHLNNGNVNASVENVEVGFTGEHSFAAQYGQNIRVRGFYGHDCTNTNTQCRGLELFVSTDSLQDVVFTDFLIERMIQGIRVFGDSPDATERSIENVEIGHGIVRDLSDTRTGSSNVSFGVGIDNASDAAIFLRKIRVHDVQVVKTPDAGVIVSCSANANCVDVTLDGLTVSDTGYIEGETTSHAAVFIDGTRTALRNSTIKLGDYDGDGTYDEGVGVNAYDCESCVIEGNTISGRPRAAFNVALIGTYNGASGNPTDLTIRGNTLNLTGVDGSNAHWAIMSAGARTVVQGNTITIPSGLTNARGISIADYSTDVRVVENSIYNPNGVGIQSAGSTSAPNSVWIERNTFSGGASGSTALSLLTGTGIATGNRCVLSAGHCITTGSSGAYRLTDNSTLGGTLYSITGSNNYYQSLPATASGTVALTANSTGKPDSLVGSGSTTDAVDLATAEVAGELADGNVSDTITVGASGSVNDAAIPSGVTRNSDVTTADAGGDTTTFPMLATAATGFLAPATDSGLSYNATTEVLTATGGIATGAGTDNARGWTSTDNTTDCADPAAGDTSVCTKAGRVYFRDTGGATTLLTTGDDFDASSELRAIMDDETGTGALVFADGAIGAATATTPSAGDDDTSVATTAFVKAGFLNRNAYLVTVCATGCDYSTVQAALDGTTGTDSQPVTIMVMPGLYDECVNVDDADDYKTIRGFSRDSVTIQCGDTEDEPTVECTGYTTDGWELIDFALENLTVYSQAATSNRVAVSCRLDSGSNITTGRRFRYHLSDVNIRNGNVGLVFLGENNAEAPSKAVSEVFVRDALIETKNDGIYLGGYLKAWTHDNVIRVKETTEFGTGDIARCFQWMNRAYAGTRFESHGDTCFARDGVIGGDINGGYYFAIIPEVALIQGAVVDFTPGAAETGNAWGISANNAVASGGSGFLYIDGATIRYKTTNAAQTAGGLRLGADARVVARNVQIVQTDIGPGTEYDVYVGADSTVLSSLKLDNVSYSTFSDAGSGVVTDLNPKLLRNFLRASDSVALPATGAPLDANSEYGLFDAAADENRSWRNERVSDFYVSDSLEAAKFRVYWSPLDDTDGGDVVWSVGICAAANDVAFPCTVSSFASVTDTEAASGNDKVYVSDWTALPTGILAAGSALVVTVFRDADNGSDTVTGDAALVGVEISYGVR